VDPSSLKLRRGPSSLKLDVASPSSLKFPAARGGALRRGKHARECGGWGGQGEIRLRPAAEAGPEEYPVWVGPN
jgi:hypothetical protein